MSQRPNKAAVSDNGMLYPARLLIISITANILLFMKNILKVRYIIFLRSFPDNYLTNLCSITFM